MIVNWDGVCARGKSSIGRRGRFGTGYVGPSTQHCRGVRELLTLLCPRRGRRPVTVTSG